MEKDDFRKTRQRLRGVFIRPVLWKILTVYHGMIDAAEKKECEYYGQKMKQILEEIEGVKYQETIMEPFGCIVEYEGLLITFVVTGELEILYFWQTKDPDDKL